MNTKSLFLAWQDKEHSRQWFPVGLLDADESLYRFRYTKGAERAQAEAKFPPLIDFPKLEKEYRSPELFPLFQNRLMSSARPDFDEYMEGLDLPKQADPMEILSVDGGRRVTDDFEVFPKIEKGADGSFQCRFFLHGWRHVNEFAQKRIHALDVNEKLYVVLELTNPETGAAVQIQTEDYHMIGWSPRYLVTDLVSAMAEGPNQFSAHVVRINPLPEPSKQRLLIEMNGHWGEHQPMSGEDFQPLVNGSTA